MSKSQAESKLGMLVAEELSKLPEEQRQLVLVWSQRALHITENQSLTVTQKARELQKLETAPFIKIMLERMFNVSKAKLWDERSWPARLALGGLAVGVAAAGTEAAGIAAFGTAIGVKVYLLTSAGGALLGTIVQELRKSHDKQR
jgi:hypothetical protein